MKFGLNDTNYNFLVQKLIQPLKQIGLKVFIFGSRSTGKNHPFSDIDILIEGEITPSIDHEIINLKNFFEESNFPYKIDLVYEKNLAKSYRDNVLKTRIEI